MKIGYARVSTADQSLNAQIAALKADGCEKLFKTKNSGISTANEEQLQELVDYVREGDVIVVTRLDRLGRSLKQILTVIDQIHSKSASVRTLDGALDSSNKSPISTAMVSLLGMFAQLERDLISTRTAEGRARAKLDGVHLGRQSALPVQTQKTIAKRLAAGEQVSVLAKEHGVSRTTIIRYRTKHGDFKSG